VEILVVLALITSAFFAWSMGHHYAGAVVGPAVGGGAITIKKGLLVAGALVLIGSLVSPVVKTYVQLTNLRPAGHYSALLSAAATTTLATYAKIPTSTIQLYTASLIGAALTVGAAVNLQLLAVLVAAWAAAPLTAYALAPLVSKLTPSNTKLLLRISMFLSALVLGLNDVSNAATSLVGVVIDFITAKGLADFFMSIGLLTWGHRLVETIGGELGNLSPRSYLAAHVTKIATLAIFNSLGLNASMNQTLIGAMAKLGAERRALKRIFIGWLTSPLLGAAFSALVTFAMATWRLG